MTALLLIFVAALVGGALGGYAGVLVAWWRIKDDVMVRLAARQMGTTGL
jgi:hypothetical protein